MEPVNIGGRSVGGSSPPYIIAEIGANHNGDMGLCRELISAAREAGAHAVKFQSWTSASLISTPEYRRRNGSTGLQTSGRTLQEVVDQYALTEDNYDLIADHCRRVGIDWFSSCFSRREVDLLDSLSVPAFKIASMDVNHLPLLRYVASKRRPVILSTGLATLGEVDRAVRELREAGAEEIVLLHCLSIYPSEPGIVNLRNLETLQKAFDLPVGYSDHCLGNAVPLASVAMGACMIEKHFTIDKSLEGWDHAISADPAELRDLVRGSEEVHAAMGSTVRSLNPAQVEKRIAFRRRMVLRRAMTPGERISDEDVEFKRPGSGIHPDELPYVVGRQVTRPLEAEAELEWEDLA